MKIKIDGTGTVNKGAELLLFSILNQIENKYPDAEIYYTDAGFLADNQHQDYFDTKLKIHKPWYTNHSIARLLKKFRINGIIGKLFKSDLSEYTRFNISEKYDLLLDASGFSISDSFEMSDHVLSQNIRYYKSLKQQGTKIVLLPQAFGPIEKKNTKEIVKALSEYVEITFAREDVSYKYLIDAGFNPEKLFVYPDFTCLTKGCVPASFEHLKGKVCLIPNMKMVSKGKLNMNEYLAYFERIIKICGQENVFVLNHEGIGDEKICTILSNKYGLPMASGLKALEIKGLISQSYCVISSRFHGVASALSSSVPCIATSWSHKYEMLFKDYGMTDCVLVLSNDADIEDKLNKVLDKQSNHNIRQHLKLQYDINAAKSNEMWSKVWGE